MGKMSLNNFRLFNRGSLFSIGNPELGSEVVQTHFAHTGKDAELAGVFNVEMKPFKGRDSNNKELEMEEREAEEWQGMD